jgi:hypothetical protein
VQSAIKIGRQVANRNPGRASEYTRKVTQFITDARIKPGSAIEITRYPNRKIYMPAIASYLSYVNVAQLIAAGYVPKVTYSSTKIDVTAPTLHHVLDQLGSLDESELRGLIVKALVRRTGGES